MIPRRVITGIVSVLLAAQLNAAASSSSETPSVIAATILCYHIVQSPSDTKFSISRETFDQQMSYLATAGYNVVSLAVVNDYLSGKRKSLPKNAVVITIDDGWKCTYTEILPVLKRLRLPFTVFIYPKFIGQSGYALNWKQVKEMSDQGVDIESHSLSHPFLTQRRHRSLDDGQYSDWLSTELVESRKVIEQKTGKPVRFLAYPYGDFDSRVVRTAAESGYDAAVTAEFGSVHPDSDRYRLRRVVIDTSMSFAQYRRLIGNRPLHVSGMTPAPGALLDESQPVIAAKIEGFKDLEPSSVGMAVLSLGPTPFSYNPSDGTISMVVREPFTTNRQQVLIWGHDRKSGRRVEATWLFYANELPPKPLPPKHDITPVAPVAPVEPAMEGDEPVEPYPTSTNPIPPSKNRRP